MNIIIPNITNCFDLTSMRGRRPHVVLQYLQDKVSEWAKREIQMKTVNQFKWVSNWTVILCSTFDFDGKLIGTCLVRIHIHFDSVTTIAITTKLLSLADYLVQCSFKNCSFCPAMLSILRKIIQFQFLLKTSVSISISL